MTRWNRPFFPVEDGAEPTKKMKNMKKKLRAEEILMGGMAAVWMVVFLSTAIGSAAEILKSLKRGITMDLWVTKVEVIIALTAVSLLILCVTTIWQIRWKESGDPKDCD